MQKLSAIASCYLPVRVPCTLAHNANSRPFPLDEKH